MTEAKKIPKDSYLFREGDAPDAMYLIKSGAFAITKTKGTTEIILAEIGAGAMVGEMAIFDMKPRSANVKAIKDSEVIVLPYEALSKQLDTLPVWIRAIMRTLNENLREANKKIKLLESTNKEEDRFPPQTINKLISLINFVGHKYGTKENDGLVIPFNRLRNYCIQVFMEPTNKMEAMQMALQALGHFKVEDLGEGRKKLTNLSPDFLFEFVDWYNDWLFKQDKDKVAFSEAEVKTMGGLVHFIRQLQPNEKGIYKLNLTEVQNRSMAEVNFLVKVDDVNPLSEKKLVSDKIMEQGSIFVTLDPVEFQRTWKMWKLLTDLKRVLK